MAGSNIRTGRRSRAGAVLLPCFVLVCACSLAAPVPAQTGAPTDSDGTRQPANPRLTPPRSSLHDPFDDHTLLAGYAAVGGGLHSDWQAGRIGYGGVVVFRPGRAAGFWNFLYDWNAGCVLQIDHQKLGNTDEVLSGDGIIRRYFRDRGAGDTEVKIFTGLGVGASRFDVPGGGGEQDTYFSAVFELGQEWLVDRRGYFFFKGQFRYHLQQGRNYRVWSVQAGAGVPWPF